ncbi:hypothetical protein T484DRAFT_2645579 [Baffinella frigidus]|nr:hypothetical protein T484DRAFT_2645579 [Cryptophyta sp. CCMP2293]
MAAEQDDPQTSMQFCKECNNLMYPKEVRETENTESRLVYVCKASQCQEASRSRNSCTPAESQMVWKHVVKHATKTDDFINNDITQDPTLPRTRNVQCAKVSLPHENDRGAYLKPMRF